MDNRLNMVEEFVKEVLSKEATGHDYFHSIRVMNNATEISVDLNVNIEILKLACLTHDLIDEKVTSNVEKSKKELLNKLEVIGYSSHIINEVINIIENVSYSKGNIPKTLVGKIVQDADRLDALGAIGIARTFAYGGNNKRLIYNPGSSDNSDSVYHFYDKLFKLTELMNTANARAIAIERTKFMKDFLLKFYNEWDGKDITAN